MKFVKQKPLKPRKKPLLKSRIPLIDPKLYCSTNEKPTVTIEENNCTIPIEEKDLGESSASNKVEDMAENSESYRENNPQDDDYESITNSSSEEFEDISSKNCWKDDGTGESALLELSRADGILPSLERELKNIEDSVSCIRRNLNRARSIVEDTLARNNGRPDEETMENIPPNQSLSDEHESLLKEMEFATLQIKCLRTKFETLLNWKATNINAPINQSRNQEWNPELNCQDQSKLTQIKKHPRAKERSNNRCSFFTFLGTILLVAALFAVLVVPPIYTKYSPKELWQSLIGLIEFKYE